MALYVLSSETSRSRRARRLARAWKRRWPLWLFSLSSLTLVYLAFFGARLPFDSLHHGHVNERTLADEVEKGKMRYDQGYKAEDVYTLVDAQGSHTSLGKESLITESTFHIKKYLSHAMTDSDLEISKHPRAKSRKRHVACEVEFMEFVDNLVQPESYMNFMQFSLEYISKEEISYENDAFGPRFGGHQTLEQREKSFYARNQTIHCGFVQKPEGYPSTGFDLSEKDKEFMDTCLIVVSSCIFGNSDFLRRPTSSKIGTYSKKNVCFMMFLDELTLKKLSSEGNVPDDMGNIGLWRIIVVKNLPYADMRKTGKVPKFLAHRLFPSARYSIWIDSKMRLITDPLLILEYFLRRTRSEYAISNHYDRHCVWEEVLQNKRLNKYNHTAIDEQFIFYQSDGLVKFNESKHSSILPSCCCTRRFIHRACTYTYVKFIFMPLV